MFKVRIHKKKGHGGYHDLFAEAINLCNYFTASLSALPGNPLLIKQNIKNVVIPMGRGMSKYTR
jgi:hypothetical protein